MQRKALDLHEVRWHNEDVIAAPRAIPKSPDDDAFKPKYHININGSKHVLGLNQQEPFAGQIEITDHDDFEIGVVHHNPVQILEDIKNKSASRGGRRLVLDIGLKN